MKTTAPNVKGLPGPVLNLEDCLRRIPKKFSDMVGVTEVLDYGAALKRSVFHWQGTCHCIISTTRRKKEWVNPFDARVRVEGFTEPETGLLLIRCKFLHPTCRFSWWHLPGRTLPYGFLESSVKGRLCVLEQGELSHILDQAALLAGEWAKKRLSEADLVATPVAKTEPAMTVEFELA